MVLLIFLTLKSTYKRWQMPFFEKEPLILILRKSGLECALLLAVILGDLMCVGLSLKNKQ